jgi:AraC-like DNA-binding protein
MPSSAVRTFSDADDYATAIRAGTIELTVTGRGDFNAKLVRIDLHRLWMQRLSDNLPRVCDVASVVSGRTYITFRTQPGPSLLQAGVEIHPSTILRHGQAREYYQRSSGSAQFGAMSLPLEDMASVGETMAGLDLTPPSDAVSITPTPAAMSRLRRLHAAAGDLAENAPEIIANPDAARGLEQALIEAMIACLGHREDQQNSTAQGQHELIMRRFRRVVEENPGEPLYIPEICKAIRVSERTLRMCCQEHLGMSPKRYLLLRRMTLARRALRLAEPGATSVTAIGTRYGFWELGRFAVEYQTLFGESPSVTLRRQSE